jgi:small subunit ribosomal protein S6
MYFRRYETLILLSPHLASDQLAAFKSKVEGILSKGEGQIVRCEERGRQKLAYPVNRELFGYYILYDYRAKSELAAELERNLKIDEQVFKYLTIVQDKNFTQEKYQAVLDHLANEASKREKEQALAAEARAAALAEQAKVSSEGASSEGQDEASVQSDEEANKEPNDYQDNEANEPREPNDDQENEADEPNNDDIPDDDLNVAEAD